jgi:hypothetical protein
MTAWTVPTIRALLVERADAVEQGILRLYERQTAEERATHATHEANGLGFNLYDADFLSSLAEQVKYSTRPVGRRLSPRQLAVGRLRLMKYAGQLADIANAPLMSVPVTE